MNGPRWSSGFSRTGFRLKQRLHRKIPRSARVSDPAAGPTGGLRSCTQGPGAGRPTVLQNGRVRRPRRTATATERHRAPFRVHPPAGNGFVRRRADRTHRLLLSSSQQVKFAFRIGFVRRFSFRQVVAHTTLTQAKPSRSLHPDHSPARVSLPEPDIRHPNCHRSSVRSIKLHSILHDGLWYSGKSAKMCWPRTENIRQSRHDRALHLSSGTSPGNLVPTCH